MVVLLGAGMVEPRCPREAQFPFAIPQLIIHFHAGRSASGRCARNCISKRRSYRIFSEPAQISGHPNDVTSSSIPAGIGAAAVARLRGTLVTLAAAARSSGGTTAIT